MAAPHGAAPGGRARLLDAARGVFAKAPYQEASVAAILDRAGVQPPTLYHHFGDKEGLFVAWAESALTELALKIGERVPHSGPCLQALTSFGECVLLANGPDLPQMLKDAGKMGRPASGEAIMNAYFVGVYEPLCGVLVRGIEHAELRPDHVGRLADTFLAGCYGLGPLFGRTVSNPGEAARWWAARFVG